MTQTQTGSGPSGADKAQRSPWYQRHPRRHTALCILGAAATGFLLFWIVAEFCTADGTKVWGTWWSVVHALVVLTVGGAGGWMTRRYRSRQSTHTDPEDDTSLLLLVLGGIFASVVIAAMVGYAQAELLTGPGEPVTSLDSSELLDIARSTTFALGALGAVAVLLVNYRKQRSVEAALRHGQAKHLADLEHERLKQRASEIAALHERYTKAVEQLANKENSAIRLGGVHALAALGDDWAAQGALSQRQVCVDLLCSYLRSTPRIVEKVETDGGVPTGGRGWEVDIEALAEDRDVRKSALEWLSRLAAADAQACETSWGESRTEPVSIDLRGIVLQGLDLSYAKLAHLHMRGADLHHANLNHADLTGADLRSADLRHAGLAHAVLDRATLTLADLLGARLRFATMTGADLSRTQLGGADFVSADLTRARLRAAKVSQKTSFQHAELTDTDFAGVTVAVLDRFAVDYTKAKNFALPGNDPVDPDRANPAAYGGGEPGTDEHGNRES